MTFFNFQFPDFVTLCEQNELRLFFSKYFTSIHESEKFSEQDILDRKKIIHDALTKNLKDRAEHSNKMKYCFKEITKKTL